MGLHQLLIETLFAPLDRSDPHRSQVQGYFPRGPSPRRLSYPVGKRMSRRFCRPMSNFAFQLSANSPGAAAPRIVAFAMLAKFTPLRSLAHPVLHKDVGPSQTPDYKIPEPGLLLLLLGEARGRAA